VVQFLDKESVKKNDSFRNSAWGPEAAEAMCKEVRHFRLPGGKDGKAITMGDLIDSTPKNSISKVMLEEKVFDTWYGGRTVLLGDCKSTLHVPLLLNSINGNMHGHLLTCAIIILIFDQ
jgi:hypothetical protein